MKNPTPEQSRALELFSATPYANLAIEAGAGTGKTSTLMLLAGSTDRRGQYIAFNGAIVRESARKFPRTVKCNTAHSLAFRAVGKPFAERLNGTARMRSLDLAIRLGIEGVKVTTWDGTDKHLTKSFLAGLAMRSVVKFCQSTDEAPSYRHVPRIPGVDAPAGPPVVARQIGRHLEPALRRIWADWTSPEGFLPYRHDAYLKLWQLSDPRIGADYILFDECQDANPVMADIVFKQQHAQLVFVGDSQQQIYGFTGAINSLAKIRDTGCATAFLTQSFRFGPAVANVANDILSVIPDAELRLRGTETIPSKVTPVAAPDAVLTRTNAAAVRTVLEAVDAGRKVALVGGSDEIVKFARAARDLMDGKRTEHPELACFESWAEVHEYVEQDEQGSDLKLLVKLVDDFTVEVILEVLALLDNEADADLIVSTAHKSKGREWDRVQLGPDFPEDQAKLDTDELRLLYVACTRAKIELDITAVTCLTQGLVRPQEVTPVEDDPEVAPEAPAPLQVIVSSHVGNVGDTVELPLRCEVAIGMASKYGNGWTHLTKLIDDSTGNVYAAFLDDELQRGTTYLVNGRVKGHGEHRGVKETSLNYVDIRDEVQV